MKPSFESLRPRIMCLCKSKCYTLCCAYSKWEKLCAGNSFRRLARAYSFYTCTLLAKLKVSHSRLGCAYCVCVYRWAAFRFMPYQQRLQNRCGRDKTGGKKRTSIMIIFWSKIHSRSKDLLFCDSVMHKQTYLLEFFNQFRRACSSACSCKRISKSFLHQSVSARFTRKYFFPSFLIPLITALKRAMTTFLFCNAPQEHPQHVCMCVCCCCYLKIRLRFSINCRSTVVSVIVHYAIHNLQPTQPNTAFCN